ALNAAKSAGKGRWVQYGPEQHASVSDRMELEVDLAHALERRQLVLHYQPAVRLADGAIVGFEAFVRWSHPRRGMVSPTDFIPLADETGLIVPLQRWVLGQACADGRQWQLGYPVASGLTMSVNVSQRGLAHPDLVADVTQACVAARFDPLPGGGTTCRARCPRQGSSGCSATAPRKPACCAWRHSSWNAPAREGQGRSPIFPPPRSRGRVGWGLIGRGAMEN